MENLISVVLPTYKRNSITLMRAINSVLDQTHKHLEVIIVDDNSRNDQFRKEVQREVENIRDERVHYVKHAENKGACRARNTGIEQSQGDFIAFLDDDDEWISTKLEMQIKKFLDPAVGLVYCDSYSIFIKKELEIEKKIRKSKHSGWIYSDLIKNNIIGSTSFVLLKKEVFSEVGKFNEKLKSAQDYELWLRVAKKYKVDKVDLPLVNYYIHDGERISTKVTNKIQGLEWLNEINKTYLLHHPEVHSLRKLKLAPFYAKEYGLKTGIYKWILAVKIYPANIVKTKYLIKTTINGIKSK
ncbi:glycosyltransferase family 2 protein [Marinococcus halophilus]|uniref:glycosyltransferase family 2 protein n=1 Tax=Marinococcus halophilus TaxID=1371 RepID=UPI0009A7A575|nr:glycosyltransferase [Marinococcus halophilus]